MGTIPTEKINLWKYSQAAQGTETSEDSRRQGLQLILIQGPLRSLRERDNAEQRRWKRERAAVSGVRWCASSC